MKNERSKEMSEHDMMNNIEFLDRDDCLLEMQMLVLIFCNLLTKNWEKYMGYN